ncbi:hypothetical protein BGX34_004336 [Mortierella sp. NVP85]|nr:hypothetical protein BGX34_004336 [Mortierella sp. NVP85]
MGGTSLYKVLDSSESPADGGSHAAPEDQQRLLPPNQQQTIITVDESSDDDSERCCRICFGTSDNKFTSVGKLISPCLCKGSSRYIHLGCLETWRRMSPKKESSYRCDTCHYHYSFARPWIANVLEKEWFLHTLTGVMYLALWIVAAYGGHAVDEKGIWEWKKLQFLERFERPLGTVLGLDWMDVVWGLSAIAGGGLVFLIGLACLCWYEDRNARRIGGSRSSSNSSSRSSSTHHGCSDGGGEGAVIVFLVGLILVG